MVKIAPYRQSRIAAWLDPFAYYQDAGWQPMHGLYALGSGGIFGVGLGQGRQKFLWLSQAHTDAIFAVIGEELGFIVAALVLLAFVVLAVRGFRIAARSTDAFGSLIAIGVTTWLVIQALINIAVVTTLIPFTGITLPIISYGGSSLSMVMIAAGLLLSVSRYAPLREVEELANDAPLPSFSQFRPRVVAAADAVRRWHGRSRVSRAGRGGRAADDRLPGSLAVGNSLGSTWRKPAPEPKRRFRFALPGRRGSRPATARERVQQRRMANRPDQRR
jgi:cell division protein FtsW